VAVSLIWSERALKEYDQLLDYLLDEWNIDIAIRVSREIDHTVLHIQNYPEHYPVFLKNKNIHRCVASPQTSIYFRVKKDVIEIISLFDNRLNPNKLKL
jgi:plasmid stabilization system protein ParE